MAVLVVLLLSYGGQILQPVLGDRVGLSDGFGSAKRFHPLPGTVVGAHCSWEVKLNTVYSRIPPTITEIICHNPNESCGGNSAYHCRQIRSRMLVGYTEGNNVVNLRNNTVSIGCACVRRHASLIQQFQQPIIEKRGPSMSKAILDAN